MADAAIPKAPGRRPPPPPATARAGVRRRVAAAARRPLLLATECVLVVSGCVFLVVGSTDVGTADQLPSKVFGGILALVGCGLLASAVGLRPRRRWEGAVGVLSLTAATAIGLYLSLNAWAEERSWALFFASVSIACAAAIVVLVRETPPAFSVKSASILSVAGFVLAFFQFTYAESARVRVGSTLTLSTDLAAVGDGQVETVAATVRTVNPTGVKIQSLGSLYVVEGVRHCRRARTVSDHDHFGDVFEHPGTVVAFSPRVAERKVVTIQAGKVFDDRTYFEPGEEVVRRFSVPIPEGAFDVLRLRVSLAVANGERLRLSEVVAGPAPLERPDGVQGIGVSYRVSESSLVDRIVHGNRLVEVVWESGSEDLVAPRLVASAQLAGAEAGEEGGLSAAYGLAYTRSTTELPIEEEDRVYAIQPPGPGVIGEPDPAPPDDACAESS